MESSKRSWVKSITWRILGILILGAITWLYTQDLKVTTGVTLIFHTIRLVLYYYHERLWNRVDWGLKKQSELSPEEKEAMDERLRKLGYIQ